MLGVDRNQLPRAHSGCHELTTDDEALLVGERKNRLGLEHRESGAEPDRTRDAVEHHVGLHGAHELARLIGPEGDVLH
jgi:hypothetical protein